MNPSENALWVQVNRALVAKNISELQYEECFAPQKTDAGYTLLLHSGVQYQFSAWQSLWGQLRVDATSLLRNGKPVTCGAQFYVDAQKELELTDIVLGNLLEECYQTLHGDIQAWHIKQGVSADQLAQMDIDAMQPYLDGHPKAVLNKGRLGWGVNELDQYTPETGKPIQLRWIAVRKNRASVGMSNPSMLNSVVASAMSEDDLALQNKLAKSLGVDSDQWIVMPVHPWQWQHVIQIHYQAWISSGDLVDLGVRGYRFLPLQSIRTLANVDKPENPNVKLPITILNTSCYRGIPGKYIEVGAQLSQWLSDVCERDPLLFDNGAMVLKEPLGVHVAHPVYNQVQGAPYRYAETLGVIWRDSVQARLANNERAMLVAALLQTDNQGNSVIQSLIRESGLTPLAWMRAYFGAVVVPLYHLLCCYGVGLVAHGQNVTLIVENGVPKRVAIKDLQGDLRLVDQDFLEMESLPDDIKQVLTRLPAPYLIHDLQTGHFVTVLRYLSALMHEQSLLPEQEFYRALAETLVAYQQDFPQLQTRFAMFDLLTPEIKRVCINRVRFKQGYDDSQERPLPTLGTDIANPLVKAMHNQMEESSL